MSVHVRKQALEAMREALDVRQDAVSRREEELAMRASEMRNAEATLQQLDVRRHQAQEAIEKLSEMQREQDASVAQTRARPRVRKEDGRGADESRRVRIPRGDEHALGERQASGCGEGADACVKTGLLAHVGRRPSPCPAPRTR